MMIKKLKALRDKYLPVLMLMFFVPLISNGQIIKQKQVLGLQQRLDSIHNLGGSVPADSLTKWALEFDIEKVHNVITTRFFGSDDYEDFFIQAWIKPMPSFNLAAWLGYIVSTGYGGAHTILWGTSCSAGAIGTGTFHLTGNFSYNGVPTLFASPIEMPIGTTHHVAISYSKSTGRVVMYVDGVPVSYTAASGFRNEGSGTDGKLYIGGSDHLNFQGLIYNYQHYEWLTPIGVGSSFYPKRSFINSVGCVLNLDFRTPREGTIPDLSNWMNGIPHDGQRNSVVPYTGNPFGSVEWANIGKDARPDSMLPRWVKDPMALSPYSGSITSAPVGAKVYDYFERTDITPASTWNSRLDSTQGGTLGKLPYTTRLNNAGILSKLAWFDATTSVPNWTNVDVSASNQDIRVGFFADNQDNLPIVNARYTDDNNKVYLYTFIDGNSYLYKVVGGVTTQVGSTFTTGDPALIRMVVSGSTIDVYYDGVLKISAGDISGVPLGTKCGFGSGSNFTFIKSFLVY